MFTGIVEELGTVEALEDQGDAVRLTVRGPLVTSDAARGDSISVNGCCLTVVTDTAADAATDGRSELFTADVMHETLAKTSLGGLEPGARVNLERAVTPATRLGGHLVQGHVDGVARVLDRTAAGDGQEIRIELPAELQRYVVEKGSVAVDGVSLTVAGVGPGWFAVALVPHTLEVTTLGRRRPGDPVQLEVDVVAKYVERLVEGRVRR
jgi:riboflavin synthase